MYVVEYEPYREHPGQWSRNKNSYTRPVGAVSLAQNYASYGYKVRIVDISSPRQPCVVWESWNPILPYWSAPEEPVMMIAAKHSWSSDQPSYQNILKSAPDRKPTDAELDRVAAEVFDEIQEVNIPVYLAVSRAKDIVEAQTLVYDHLPRTHRFTSSALVSRNPYVLVFKTRCDDEDYTVVVHSVFEGIDLIVSGRGIYRGYVESQYRRALTAPVQP